MTRATGVDLTESMGSGVRAELDSSACDLGQPARLLWATVSALRERRQCLVCERAVSAGPGPWWPSLGLGATCSQEAGGHGDPAPWVLHWAGGPSPHYKAPQEGWPRASQEARELGAQQHALKLRGRSYNR